jgi:hypothetical protein
VTEDVLLPLARHIDEGARRRAYEAALALGFEPGRAGALASAMAIQDAVDSVGGRRSADGECGDVPDITDLLREIGAVSDALRRGEDLAAVRGASGAGRKGGWAGPSGVGRQGPFHYERPIRSRGPVPCIARRRKVLVAELSGPFGNAAGCGAGPPAPDGHGERTP